MGFEGCRGSGEVDDACWLICVAWNGRGEQGGGRLMHCPFYHIHHTGKKTMKKSLSSTSSSNTSISANALVRSTMARVSSLARPSDDDVARLIALEVRGDVDGQGLRLGKDQGNVASSRPKLDHLITGRGCCPQRTAWCSDSSRHAEEARH